MDKDNELKTAAKEMKGLSNQLAHCKGEYDNVKREMSLKEKELNGMKRAHEDLQGRFDTLMEEAKESQQKLDNLKDYTQNINALNVEQLDLLKQRFEYKLNQIARAKEKIFENEVLCMICMDNRKNVLIQGCNHYVMCDKCEARLYRRKCPKCQKTYSNVMKIFV